MNILTTYLHIDKYLTAGNHLSISRIKMNFNYCFVNNLVWPIFRGIRQIFFFKSRIKNHGPMNYNYLWFPSLHKALELSFKTVFKWLTTIHGASWKACLAIALLQCVTFWHTVLLRYRKCFTLLRLQYCLFRDDHHLF